MFLGTQLSLFNIGGKYTRVWTPGAEGPTGHLAGCLAHMSRAHPYLGVGLTQGSEENRQMEV